MCRSFLDELRGVPPSRPLVIAAGHTAYLYLLGGTIRAALADQPGSLRPLHTNRHQMHAAVLTGRAHLGVFSLHVQPDDLVTVPIATYPQMLLMPDDHRLARRRTLRLKDLQGAELVVPPPARPHRINLERALAAAGVQWTVAVEAEGLPMTLDFAAFGVGLAVVAGCVDPRPDWSPAGSPTFRSSPSKQFTDPAPLTIRESPDSLAVSALAFRLLPAALRQADQGRRSDDDRQYVRSNRSARCSGLRRLDCRATRDNREMPSLVDPDTAHEIDIIAVASDDDPDLWAAVPGEVVAIWKGGQVDLALALIASLPDGEQMRCFLPRHGVRVRAGSTILVEVAFCFRCHNARVFPSAFTPDLPTWFAFDADAPAAQQLLSLFRGCSDGRDTT